ncbi:MAG: DUF4231 domain-containing protein [Coriobacteriia bacterium]|nr:DUF4231 domain-containing protein [Coriobacteriia bacterium]MBN2822800.1 DUF4231 domain-containing protein [Coriobacteriia bacterium]
MSESRIETYVSDRLQDQITYHDASAVRAQRAFRRLAIISIAATALTPLLLASEMVFSPPPTDEPLQMVVEILPIVISVIAAAATISLSAFKYKDTWIAHRMACESLRREMQLHSFGAGPYAMATDPDALLVERAEVIMSEGDTAWQSFQADAGAGIDGMGT